MRLTPRRVPRPGVGPHVSEKRAQLDHICAETKRALATSDQQAGSPPAHICAGTAPISAHSRTGGPLRPTSGMGPRVVGA